LDWASAAHKADFRFVDGVVAAHYLSMPIANRPSPSWTDAFIRGRAYRYAARLADGASDDVDAVVELIRLVADNRDPGRVAKIDIALDIGYLDPTDATADDVLDYFYAQIGELVAEGGIPWATEHEVYDAFRAARH